MEIDPTIGTTILALTFLIGMGIVTWSNPVARARLLARIRKKNYGVINVLTKGKRIVQFVQDLSEPIYTFRNMVLDPQKQNPFSVYSIGEVPIMFYYDVDASPVILETKVDEHSFDLELNAKGKSQLLPIIIEPELKKQAATFNSDPNALFAAFEAYSELLRRQMAMKLMQFQLLIIGAVILSAIAAYFSYDLGGKFDHLSKQMTDLQAAVSAMKAIAAAPVA